MWIYLPRSTSSASAPATEPEISRSNWQFQVLALYCTSKEKHMPSRLWYVQSKQAHWMTRLCSQMCEPATAERGAAEWIASLPLIRASRSQRPGSDWEKPTRATCGPISQESSEKPNLPWCSSKMSETICASDSSVSAKIYARWATTLGQDYSARLKQALRTGELGCSHWRTPDSPGDGGVRNRQGSTGQGHQITVAEQAEHWGTPNAHDATGARGAGFELTDHHYKPHDLIRHVENWPSPDAANINEGDTRFLERREELRQKRINWNGAGIPLAVSVSNWQSPQSRDFRNGDITPKTKAKHLGSCPLNEEVLNWSTPRLKGDQDNARAYSKTRHQGDDLHIQTQNWPSPNAADSERGSLTMMRGNPTLKGAVLNWPSPRAEDWEACGNHPEATDSLTGSRRNWLTPCGGSGTDHTGKHGAGGEHAEQATTWSAPPPSLPTEPETGTGGAWCLKRHLGCGLRWADSMNSFISADALVYSLWATRAHLNRWAGCSPRNSTKRKLNVYFDEWLMGWPVNLSSAENALTGFERWVSESSRLLWHLLSAYSRRHTDSNSMQRSLFE